MVWIPGHSDWRGVFLDEISPFLIWRGDFSDWRATFLGWRRGFTGWRGGFLEGKGSFLAIGGFSGPFVAGSSWERWVWSDWRTGFRRNRDRAREEAWQVEETTVVSDFLFQICPACGAFADLTMAASALN